MRGGLAFEVVRGHPVVLRAVGVLDALTAPDVRAALLSCLAEQPAALVLDAADLTVADEVGLTVLAGVARESDRWPGTRLAVAAGPELFAAAGRMGIHAALPFCPDLPTAIAHVQGVPVPPTVRVHIAPDRDAPGRARAAVKAFCEQQQVGGDRDAAQLVASELVTNAVVHAGTEIDLTLRLVSGLLHLAVRDGGPGRPTITSLVEESAESGRGLLLVDALAVTWGTFFPPTGKIVWATVRIRPL
jgi:anti-anti-sigma regulatory factor